MLADFKPEISAYAAQGARAGWASRSRLGKPVTDDSAPVGVALATRLLEAETIIWAAGVLASPAARWLGVEADRAGRIKVDADLSVPGHPKIFAIGDTVTAAVADGKPVPGIGDAAKQGGRHAAEGDQGAAARRHAAMPFHYAHLGDIATIGRREALIDFGWIKLTGWIGWWTWGLAHIYFLIGLKNRIFVALNWLWIYLTGYRSARLITEDRRRSAHRQQTVRRQQKRRQRRGQVRKRQTSGFSRMPSTSPMKARRASMRAAMSGNLSRSSPCPRYRAARCHLRCWPSNRAADRRDDVALDRLAGVKRSVELG